MAASQISTPNVGTVDLATDEIDGRHHQATKVFGGGEGVANELRVSGAGSAAVAGTALLLAPTIAPGQSSYDDGDFVGAPALFNDIPGGFYRLAQLNMIYTDPAGTLPPLTVLLLPLANAATIGDLPPDGTPAAGIIEIAAALDVPSAALPSSSVFPFVRKLAPNHPVFLPIADAGAMTFESPNALAFGLVADGAIAVDLSSATIVASFVLLRVAETI